MKVPYQSARFFLGRGSMMERWTYASLRIFLQQPQALSMRAPHVFAPQDVSSWRTVICVYLRVYTCGYECVYIVCTCVCQSVSSSIVLILKNIVFPCFLKAMVNWHSIWTACPRIVMAFSFSTCGWKISDGWIMGNPTCWTISVKAFGKAPSQSMT